MKDVVALQRGHLLVLLEFIQAYGTRFLVTLRFFIALEAVLDELFHLWKSLYLLHPDLILAPGGIPSDQVSGSNRSQEEEERRQNPSDALPQHHTG